MKKIWKFLILIAIVITIFSYFTINNTTIAAEMKVYFYVPNDWNSNIVYINYWNVPNDVGWPGHKMNFEREASGGKVYSYSLLNSESSQKNIGIVFSIGNSSYQTVNIDNYTMEYLNGKLIIPKQREYITSGNYLVECRTYTDTDPIGSTDPTDPIDPTDPTDPIDPTDPTDPTGPTDPTDPTDPKDQNNSTNPTKPEDPKNTVNSAGAIINNEKSNKDSTIANTKIPKTGININVIALMLLISITSSIYCLIKYKKM